MKMKLVALAGPISVFFLSTAVLAEKPLCPSGQVYTCEGGINGVHCWCEDRDIEDCLIFDLGSGSLDVAPPGTEGLEVALQSRIPAKSDCRIDYKIGLKVFDGVETNLIPLGRGTLSGRSPDVLMPLVPMREYARATSPRVYYTLIGKGEAHRCHITDFLSFTATAITFDADGGLNSGFTTQPAFTPITDEHTLPDSALIPPIFPPNPDAFTLPE